MDIFRSGVPAIIATIGLVIFAYLAAVRRDRLARYWAGAWALLLARYTWNATVDQSLAIPDYVDGALRIAFAGTVFAGVWSLTREPLRYRWIVLAALIVPAVGEFFEQVVGVRGVGSSVRLGAQAIFLSAAALMLFGIESLPRAERSTAGLALIGYVISSTVAVHMDNGSSALLVALAAAWTCLLLVAFGFFAMCFRQAYEAELRARDAMSSTLTRALGEFVSVCMHCRAVQDEQQQWQPLEKFVAASRKTQISHGLCDSCADEHYAELKVV